MADASEEYLVVAVVRRPHGVRGELQLSLETDRPTAVFRKGAVLRLGDAAGRPGEGVLTVERAKVVKDGVLLKAAEHASRDEVEALRGRTLLIPAGAAAPAGADEVPYHRLVGSAVLHQGARVGTVDAVVEAGGGEMLVVRRAGRGELLVPFVREIVTRVDPEARTVEIAPPEGLLEL